MKPIVRLKTVMATVLACAAVYFGGAVTKPAIGQEPGGGPCADGVESCRSGGNVVYMPPFFSRYNPVTALDMVERVPGFSIDRGENVRGFGGAAGNVLIDGQRPSTKSADIAESLGRIGAGNVERIELIRGGTGGLDVGGQAVVVNVVRKSGGGREPAPWELSFLKRRPNGGFRPYGEISYSDNIGATKYTIGADVFAASLRFGADEEITRLAGNDETRRRDGVFREQRGGVNFKLERPFKNGDTARLSFESSFSKMREDFSETRNLAGGGADLALFTFPVERFSYEIGADYEHEISDLFGAKFIALFSRENETFENGFELLPQDGAPERSVFLSDQTAGEIIGRLEFDWKGWRGHTVQFGGEIARNFIDSQAQLLVETDMGALSPVAIDGANTRVSELRGEAFVSDSVALADKLTLDAGFALETSRIAQTGDGANSRFFVYPKPTATMTFTPSEKTQWRFTAAREVNQLSFDEFVSAVNFDDEDVDFGNPELQPQRSWAAEIAFERRFGTIGVFEIVGFFDFIQDVEDLLPVGDGAEAPGNIGNGKIYGGTVNLTAPMDWVGLKNARVQASITQRASQVTDPVTGRSREISFTPNRIFDVEFRQDFPAQKISWGWEVGKRSEERSFGLDELSRLTADLVIHAFVETTVIDGVKLRFVARDIANVTDTRDRTVFDGSRVFNRPLLREVRRSNNGGALRLDLSGTF